jgi:hypothetical protein
VRRPGRSARLNCQVASGAILHSLASTNTIAPERMAAQ